MAENLNISNSKNKAEKYKTLLPQVKALIDGENNLLANLANISAALKMTFNFLWVGFYFVDESTLVLGPFQGSIACTRIQKGKGVCGTAWKEKRTLVVDDVNQFEGHIFCNSSAKSEIVVPIFNKFDKVELVLDIDSAEYQTFDEYDAHYLKELTNLISPFL